MTFAPVSSFDGCSGSFASLLLTGCVACVRSRLLLRVRGFWRLASTFEDIGCAALARTGMPCRLSDGDGIACVVTADTRWWSPCLKPRLRGARLCHGARSSAHRITLRFRAPTRLLHPDPPCDPAVRGASVEVSRPVSISALRDPSPRTLYVVHIVRALVNSF